MITRILCFCLLTHPVLAGDPPLGDKGGLTDAKAAIIMPPTLSPWRVGTGLMWRNIGKLSVNPGLRSGAFAGSFFTPNPTAGQSNSPADRTYDDGFVNQGAATPFSGLTTFWGYQNDSQVSASGLTYSLAGGLALESPGANRDRNTDTVAPYIELSYLLPVKPGFLAGFTTTFSVTGLKGSVYNRMAVSDVTTIDTYMLNGVIPPAAGYSGSFSGPGPLISNQPSSRDYLLSPSGNSSNYLFSADTDLYSLAFGGELEWQPVDHVYLGLSGGVVMNYADWDASWRATLLNPVIPDYAFANSAKSDRKFLFGTYLKASATIQVDDQWSLGCFLRYDWNEDLKAHVGPSSFELDLSGWSIGMGVSYRY